MDETPERRLIAKINAFANFDEMRDWADYFLCSYAPSGLKDIESVYARLQQRVAEFWQAQAAREGTGSW